KGSTSEDEKALITPVFFKETASTDQLQTALDALEEKMKSQFGDEVFGELDGSELHVRFSGPVGIQTDTVSLFSNADITLLISTVILVFALLIVLYRSQLLAIVKLVADGIYSCVSRAFLGLL